MGDNIKVSVRLRGLIAREIQSKSSILWEARNKTTVSTINSNSNSFSYDRVFAADENNEVVYDDVCSPIVKSVVNGFNGTIFAYGQTSSGKTYTLMGDGKFDFGIAHHSVYNLFEHIQKMANHEFLLRISLMEIYNNEKVIDLLAKKSDENLKLQDDQYGICKVLNLTEAEVQEPDQVLELLKSGQKRRKTEETLMNQKSSRSHLIFRIIIESRLRFNENAAVKVSHFNIVDLAGSEKPSENASGTRFKEGVNINTSLLNLSRVINQLSIGKESQFIPYRASKLTRILKNSLGGNALTAIICNITPSSYDETLSTLKFALNAKKIKNKPRVNEVETEETLIRSYANKITILTKQLEATKEEKNQEAKKRQDMEEEIEALRKKFVHFTPGNNITRSTRRETWGGCLDPIRMKNLFQPSRPLKLAVVDEENEMTTDILDYDKTFSGYDKLFNRMSTASSIYSLDLNPSECLRKEDVAIQTECLQNDERSSELSAEKNVKQYEEKITELLKELSDLKCFTTLEKQMYTDNSSEKVMNRSMNRSTFSPRLEKSRMSDVNNLSLDEESFGILSSLLNRKSQADQNIIDLDQEMFFQNLNTIIVKINSILNVESLLPSIANPYFKVIYQLANIIFQKHFVGKGINEQVEEMFALLTKIFTGFSNQESSGEQNSELIIHFDEMSAKLFEDFEKRSISPDIDTDDKVVNVPDIINVSYSGSPNINLSLSNCQCKNQIKSLEEAINAHLETITHLQNNHESLKKQVTLSEDKIKIQEQVIASLENEMKLKIKDCAEMTDNFTQTSYMTLMNISCIESSDRTSLPKELHSSDTNIGKMNCSNCSKYQHGATEQNTSDFELSSIKKEISDLRLFTQKMMESSMPQAYYTNTTENESLKILDANLDNSLEVDIAALKNSLHRIKFYLKDKSEHSEHLGNEMLAKMAEISSLQKQCSSTEMVLQQKENLLNSLNADICEFRKEVSERRLAIMAIGVEVKYLDVDDIRAIDDLTYLKKVMKSFSDAVIDSYTALKELRQQHTSKQSKITQTVENYPDLAALEEVRAHEFRERANLCQENASLKLKVEEFIKRVEVLELSLKLKENDVSEIQKSYEEKVEENLACRKELQKSLMETMQTHIKEIEDRYEEELKNQEKSLFDMMDGKLTSLKEEYKSEQERKQEHYKKIISDLTAKCETIKSDLQSKLAEEVHNHEQSKLKLRSEIRDFKNREESAKLAYYKMKDKFKEYVKGVQNMRMNNAKCVKEKETQTNSENSSLEGCIECRTLRQAQKELKALTELKCTEMASLESSNKIMAREIAALKKDLTRKSALLRTCNCRLFAKPKDLVSHQTKISDSAEVPHNQDPIEKRTSLDPKEILNLDFVQKAINEAKESERAMFISNDGAASQEMCYYIKRKLAKKDKEISELKAMLSQKQLKIAPVKNPTQKLNLENMPMHPLDTEVLNNFTPSFKIANKPFDDAELKVHPKKILNEMNKLENAEPPRNKWFMTKEEEEVAKQLDENQQKYRSGELECKQQ